MNKTLRNINMTEGAMLGNIIRFVLPMMAANLLQVFYNAADMMIVGLSSEPDAVGAIGTTGAFINLVLNVFIGFSVGANVVVARNIGAGREREANEAVHTSLILGVLLGFVGMGIGLVAARPVLSTMGAEAKLLDLAVTYTAIYFIGAPFLAVTNYSVAILRAGGDTTTPLVVLGTCGLVNVALNLLFVLAFGMSVDGVALATVISNALSSVWLIVHLIRVDGACHFSFKRLRIKKNALRDVLLIGVPAGIQGSLFSLSNMMIQSSIIRVNGILAPPDATFQPVVKANASVSNLEGFIYTATNSVCQASITFTSQNVGCGKYDRVKRVMVNCYATTVAIALLVSGVILIFRDPLLALYGVVDGADGTLEHIAYNTATVRLKCVVMPYFILGLMEVGSGVVRGLGRSMTSTVISLVGSCLLRIVWLATVFEHFLTAESIFISYPVSWALTAIVQFVFALVIIRKDEAHRRLKEKYNIIT